METPVKSFAFRDADAMVYATARAKLEAAFPGLQFLYSDKDGTDILHIASGGSEREVITAMKPGNTYLLLAGREGNSWAAATEVKAWADHQNITAILVSQDDKNSERLLQQFTIATKAFNSLAGKRAGLIGGVSHWLVASSFPLELARERLGIHIEALPWEQLPDYLSSEPDSEFLETFKAHEPGKLQDEARIHHFLKIIIALHQLDAITLECFTMVKSKEVTACLSLSLLNSRGIVAACEGDLVSLAGMMLVQALTGHIPWMANVASINTDHVLLAHCTAPLDFLSDYSINTHFETDKSAAVQGDVSINEVTVFRLNHSLNKAFIATGKILSRPQHRFACRTQIELALPVEAMEKLRHNPLGNHHLVIPGNQEALLKIACQYKNIQVV
jgi:L-fucose isomerase-like protein